MAIFGDLQQCQPRQGVQRLQGKVDDQQCLLVGGSAVAAADRQCRPRLPESGRILAGVTLALLVSAWLWWWD